jgi:hypothetical protein
MRDRLGVKGIRRAVQAKLAGTVDEVLRRHRAEQTAHIDEQFRKIEQRFERFEQSQEELRRQIGRTADRVGELETRMRRDITLAGDQHATLEASIFATEQMTTAKQCAYAHETFEYALTLAPTGGLALEFGVYSGATLKVIAAARGGERVFGFDSFKGLPSDWRSGFPAGIFQVEDPPDVPGAELVIGLFDDVLPEFLDAHPGVVDFLHVDSDLYSSAKTVLDLVGPRLAVGSVIVFDEFFNYPGWRQHEYRAWAEYVERTGVRFDYRAYSSDNEQVVVQITGL